MLVEYHVRQVCKTRASLRCSVLDLIQHGALIGTIAGSLYDRVYKRVSCSNADILTTREM